MVKVEDLLGRLELIVRNPFYSALSKFRGPFYVVKIPVDIPKLDEIEKGLPDDDFFDTPFFIGMPDIQPYDLEEKPLPDGSAFRAAVARGKDDLGKCFGVIVESLGSRRYLMRIYTNDENFVHANPGLNFEEYQRSFRPFFRRHHE